ncbi:hypothetical protein SASPL_130005 [Salvia splendens]|uniref:CASP-like protein n=1 Tax=Salvia splendens TaxID=180675 RepID=A0A8X8X3G2_SALSN|nr:uncharacterized protein LOC121756001 [Salvia splendens]KAG6407025.1 hypothetical protein SASPL_130005 [Salvia splendens]
MVKSLDICICLFILALDIYAAVLGWEAEEAQNQKLGKFLDVFVCLFIVALDAVGGKLGLKAYDAEGQERHLKLWMIECKGPSHGAFVLGIGAASLLVIAHVIANSPCFVTMKTSSNKTLAKIFLVITWFVMLIGLGLLAFGIKSNHESSRESCSVKLVVVHVLKYGGYSCMVHAFFAVAYYATATSLFTWGD